MNITVPARVLPLVAVIAFLTGACASTPPDRKLIDQAAAALGGADRVRALKALSITGRGPAPNLGQNRMPNDELPVWEVTEHVRVIDFTSARTRVRQVREARFQFAGAPTQRVTQGLDGDIAYNVGPNGMAVRASDTAARDRRLELLHHPITIVRAALEPTASLSNLRTEGSQQLVDVTTAAGDVVTLAVETATGLPARVRTMGYNANLGDVPIETTFADYNDVAGLKLPRRLTTMIDKYPQFDLSVSSQSVDGDVSDLALDPNVAASAAPVPPPVAVTVEQVAPGVWWLAGSGNHRSVVFEFADHLTLFEVPLNEARSKAVIDRARTLSDKPLTTAIVSHHHFDHSGGLRVAVAEGLTIVTHRDNEAFFKDLLARSHTLVPEALQQRPAPATFSFVDDQLTLKDAAMEVQLYHLLDNPREGTNLFAYLPRQRVLVQADLYDATWEQHPWGDNVLENIQRRKLTPQRSVPVHGSVEPYDQMVRTIRARRTPNVTN